MDATNWWTFAFVGLTFVGYLWIGWRSRVRDSEGFYVAGHGVPAFANGAATAADWMSAASFISMAGLISFLGSDGSFYLMGWTGGYVLLALLLAPYLRKFGQYTVPDFIGARYASEGARVVAAICAVFISMTYVSGQMRGVGIVFSRFLEVEVWQGVVVGMVIVAFFAVLGGMKGITWTQVAQFFVLILAFLIPSVALSRELTGSFIPQLGFTREGVAAALNDLHRELGFAEYTQAFAHRSQLDILCIVFALMAGTAGLPHVIVRFYTVKSVRAARYSAAWALFFIAILYTTAPALAMFARWNLLETLHGAQVSEVEEVIADDGTTRKLYHLTDPERGEAIEWALSWQHTGLLSFDDADGDGSISMASRDGVFAETTVDPDIIVVSTPEIARLPPWVVALVAAGALAAALSTAAGLLLVISSSIAHDLWVHFVDPDASEEKRLRIGRRMILLAVVVAGYFGIRPPGFVAQVVAFAFGLAASTFFPAILMGIFDKRMNRQGAVTGMIVGLLFTSFYILGSRWDMIFHIERPADWIAPWYQTQWLMGISPEGIGAVGAALNWSLAMLISRATPPPPAQVIELVERIRLPENAPA